MHRGSSDLNFKKKIADKYLNELEDIKQLVKTSSTYFADNNKRFTEFHRFICETALTQDVRTKLGILNKPAIEFNQCEAYINKQLAEFSKQQPGIEVRASSSVSPENLTPELTKTIQQIEDFTRYLISPERTDNFAYKIFADMLKGGFSVGWVGTDYEHDFSMNQEIELGKEAFPTMCGFDPMASESHKGDGEYCFRLIAHSQVDAEALLGKEAVAKMSSSNIGGFNWSYQGVNEKIVLFCDLYKKKKKRTKIVYLSNGMTVTRREYDNILQQWEEQMFIEQAPIIVDERWTSYDVICRYFFSESKLLSYEETDYKYLPMVFFDGSSVMLQNPEGTDKHQMTRPYVYHLKGIQQLINVTGQSMTYEIENMVAHKFMAAKESIDMTDLDAWKNPQLANVLLWQYHKNGNSDEPLPPPREIHREQVPAIIPQTFHESRNMMQTILGSYDAQMGVQHGNISGHAIQQGAMQSSGNVSPYLMGFINGLNRMCQIIIDLIPKYYRTARSLPILKADGKREYIVINADGDPNSTYMNYDPHMLNVEVKAGVNTDLQKRLALEQIISMTKVSPVFAQFMNEEGLEIFLDNLDIRGIDSLKEKSTEWMRQLRQKQMMAEQQPPKPDAVEATMQIENEKIRQKEQELQAKTAIDSAKVQAENRKIDLQFLDLLAKVKEQGINTEIKQQEAESENVRSAAMLGIELSKHKNEMKKDSLDRMERALIHRDDNSLEHKKVDKSHANHKPQVKEVVNEEDIIV